MVNMHHVHFLSRAFEYNVWIAGWQIHLESLLEGIKLWIQDCADEIANP